MITCEQFLIALYTLKLQSQDKNNFSEQLLLQKIAMLFKMDPKQLLPELKTLMDSGKNPCLLNFCVEKKLDDEVVYEINYGWDILRDVNFLFEFEEKVREYFTKNAPSAYDLYSKVYALYLEKLSELPVNTFFDFLPSDDVPHGESHFKPEKVTFPQEIENEILSLLPLCKVAAREHNQLSITSNLTLLPYSGDNVSPSPLLINRINLKNIFIVLCQNTIEQPLGMTYFELISWLIPSSIEREQIKAACELLVKKIAELIGKGYCFAYTENYLGELQSKEKELLRPPYFLLQKDKVFNAEELGVSSDMKELHDKARQAVSQFLAKYKQTNNIKTDEKIFYFSQSMNEKDLIFKAETFANLRLKKKTRLILTAYLQLMPYKNSIECPVAEVIKKLDSGFENLFRSRSNEAKTVISNLFAEILACEYLMGYIKMIGENHTCYYVKLDDLKIMDPNDFDNINQKFIDSYTQVKNVTLGVQELNGWLITVIRSLCRHSLQNGIFEVTFDKLRKLTAHVPEKKRSSVIQALEKKFIIERNNDKYLLLFTSDTSTNIANISTDLMPYYIATKKLYSVTYNAELAQKPKMPTKDTQILPTTTSVPSDLAPLLQKFNIYSAKRQGEPLVNSADKIRKITEGEVITETDPQLTMDKKLL